MKLSISIAVTGDSYGSPAYFSEEVERIIPAPRRPEPGEPGFERRTETREQNWERADSELLQVSSSMVERAHEAIEREAMADAQRVEHIVAEREDRERVEKALAAEAETEQPDRSPEGEPSVLAD